MALVAAVSRHDRRRSGRSGSRVQPPGIRQRRPLVCQRARPVGDDELLVRVLRNRFDLILLEGAPLARFLGRLPSHVPRVLDLFDVHSLMTQRDVEVGAPADREALSREAKRTLAWERHAAENTSHCLTVSNEEAAVARELLHAASVHVVPNGVDTEFFAPRGGHSQKSALLFTGRMNYEPNADAAVYAAEKILPVVRQQVPGATLHVVGANPTPKVSALASDAVAVYGRVEDVRPHHQNAEVVIVPVRKGGGTRLKVLEAAAAGKAIVSTTLGVEGLAFRPGRDVLVADTPESLAAAVVSLLGDPGRRAELGAHARTVACRYDWKGIGVDFRKLIERFIRDARN
ncbi:MAG: glycosyltransferase [Vicinamibacterales bacterium]